MMTRRRLTIATLLLVLAGCTTSDTTAPRFDGNVSGASFAKKASKAENQPVVCNVDAPLFASAVIGPAGGELDVGPHRLIVPPGALTKQTYISGSIPAGPRIEIDFQPSGLQFKKPAGLILNATSCGEVPDVVYLNEEGGAGARIEAIFSKLWHTVAAPIEHFSGYMLEV